MRFGDYVRGVALVVALAVGSSGCAGYSLGSSSSYPPADRARLEAIAKSGSTDERRNGLKGLCGLVYKKKVDSAEAKQITDFVYNQFDENASKVTVYPVAKIWNLHTKQLRTVGHRHQLPISWEKTKEVFSDDRAPVIEACAKMGKDYVSTTTPEEFDKHKALISTSRLGELYGKIDVLKGITWPELINGKNYRAADNGHNISIGFK